MVCSVKQDNKGYKRDFILESRFIYGAGEIEFRTGSGRSLGIPTMLKRFFRFLGGSAILWGGLCSFGFYYSLHHGIIQNQLIFRYCAGHPVAYATVIMFFIGMADLAIKFRRILYEKRSVARGMIFPPVREEKENLDQIDEYRTTLKTAKKVRGDNRYIQRLSVVLDYLKQNSGGDDLEQELRYLSEEDEIKADSSYGMVRMFIWAIPILGFLGTVIGITKALGNLDLTELEATGELLASGLQVAFDTTALALTLVFGLYFSLFFVRGQESGLFAVIDKMAAREMLGRFAFSGSAGTQEMEPVRQALTLVAHSFGEMTRIQTERWKNAMSRIDEQTRNISRDSCRQVESVLRESLVACQTEFVTNTVAPLVAAMSEKTLYLNTLEEKMVQESRVLQEVVQAMGHVAGLEERLRQNLDTLAGVGCFEEAINSLSATVQLLNTRLTGSSLNRSELRIASEPDESQNKDFCGEGSGNADKMERIVKDIDRSLSSRLTKHSRKERSA